MKYLIAGGDSFSSETKNFSADDWPHVFSRVNDFICYNNAIPSSGNDYIARSVLHCVYTTLNAGIPKKDIIVAPMWTYPDRKSFFINKKETLMWENLSNYNGRTYVVNPASFIKRNENYNLHYKHASRVETSGWVIGESTSLGKNDDIGAFKKPYLLEYKTDEGTIIETLEWILFLQHFCKANGITMINLCFSFPAIFCYPHYIPRDVKNTTTPITETYKENCKYLVDLIDFSTWVRPGLIDYCDENNLSFLDAIHPSPNSSEIYVENVLQPYFKNLSSIIN